ncbi:hypothetical protein GCM10020229_12300 [Kitasatospora albolonga]|uniref:ester cyclase family protein n=1 Tax=Kitasatospora albolonga TaxID=68173 RepID=UPI0031E5AE4F
MTTERRTDAPAGNERTVRELYRVLHGEHQLDRTEEFFHPGYTDHDALLGGGTENFRRHWKDLTTRHPGLAATVDHLVAGPDRVMLFATWRSPGGFLLHTAELYRLADGRVAEHWNVVDRAALAAQGTGPAEPGQPASPGLHGPHTEAERANAQLVLDAYREVFSEHRLELAERYYHPDYKHHNVRTDAVPDGLEAFKAFFADNIAAFPDLLTDVDHVVASGDRVMVFVTWRGTLTGAWSGGGPSDARLEMRTCDQFRIERGKVAEHWEVVDYLALQEAGLPTP